MGSALPLRSPSIHTTTLPSPVLSFVMTELSAMLGPQTALSAPVGADGSGRSGDLSRTVPLTVAGEATLTTL